MPVILYYRNKCIGCNACVEAAPAHFRMSRKDGKSTLIDGKERKGVFSKQADNGQTDELQNAASNCPVKIIQVQK